MTTAAQAGMVIERDVAIPMADGVALAADIFRPSAGPPVPVIMSMGPYGKGTWFRDWQRAEWDGLITRHPEVLDGSAGQHMVWELADPERWVPHGYAVVRVDSRGAGRSPGYLDCLSPQETADFCQAIEWAAAQPKVICFRWISSPPTMDIRDLLKLRKGRTRPHANCLRGQSWRASELGRSPGTRPRPQLSPTRCISSKRS